MKKLWIKRKNAPELLLFFNGWGMDEKPFRQLALDDKLDVLVVYDYTVLDKVGDLSAYKTVHLVAWSLGVFAAARVLAGMKFASALAINGTLKPIDEAEGIAPSIFQGTIDSWSEAAGMKFNRRMCGVKYNREFNANAPERSIDGQKAELIALKEHIMNSPVPENIFTEAVISLDDKIFTRHAQEKHWTNARIPIKIIAEPHYFFPALKSWRELIAL